MSDRPDYSLEKREFRPCLTFAEKEKTDDYANHGIHGAKSPVQFKVMLVKAMHSRLHTSFLKCPISF